MAKDSQYIKRLRFRAWHRGTREADYLIGGFFEQYHQQWDSRQLAWFTALVDCEDVDILDWAMAYADPPTALNHQDMIAALRRLDYIPHPCPHP